MEALLGFAAFGVSPLALPWGSSACYTQPAGQRRGGKATLVKKAACAETLPTARQSVVLQAHYSDIFKLYQSCS